MIERKRGVCGGRPIISGTRLEPKQIQGLHARGLSFAEIVDMYPWLSLEQVEAAVEYRYYSDNATPMHPLREALSHADACVGCGHQGCLFLPPDERSASGNCECHLYMPPSAVAALAALFNAVGTYLEDQT